MCNVKKKNKQTNKQTTRNKKTRSTYQRTLASKWMPLGFFCHIIYDKSTLFVWFQSNLQQALDQCRQAKKRGSKTRGEESSATPRYSRNFSRCAFPIILEPWVTFNVSCSSSHSTSRWPWWPTRPFTVHSFTFTVCCLLFSLWRLSTWLR